VNYVIFRNAFGLELIIVLLEYGNVICGPDWIIDEKIPLGYSRVYYVYNGEVHYSDEQCRTCLKKGYLYIFPSASTYGMKQNIRNPLQCTFMHIDFFPSILTELVEVQVDRYPALKHFLLSIAESISADDIKLLHAMVDVFKIYCKEHQFITSPESRISRLLLYIADNIGKKLTVEELSRLAGYNVQYFVRIFKRNIGCSPYQYITSYRLKEARKMLRTDAPITEIAKKTGYNDIKSFSRSFKKKFGVSPTEFRNFYVSQP